MYLHISLIIFIEVKCVVERVERRELGDDTLKPQVSYQMNILNINGVIEKCIAAGKFKSVFYKKKATSSI